MGSLEEGKNDQPDICSERDRHDGTLDVNRCEVQKIDSLRPTCSTRMTIINSGTVRTGYTLSQICDGKTADRIRPSKL